MVISTHVFENGLVPTVAVCIAYATVFQTVPIFLSAGNLGNINPYMICSLSCEYISSVEDHITPYVFFRRILVTEIKRC